MPREGRRGSAAQLAATSRTGKFYHGRYHGLVRGFARFLAFLLLLIIIGGGVAWLWAGRQPGPAVQFRQPDKFVGQTSELELMVQAPEGRLSRLDVAVEQNGKSFPVFALDQPTQATTR